jgi:putative endonuclease
LSLGAVASWSLSKSRRAEALEAVTERTKQRVIGAAELWLARHPKDASGDIRFDVIVVTPGAMPRHIVNAFNASG